MDIFQEQLKVEEGFPAAQVGAVKDDDVMIYKPYCVLSTMCFNTLVKWEVCNTSSFSPVTKHSVFLFCFLSSQAIVICTVSGTI